MRHSKSIVAALLLFALFAAVIYFRILETRAYAPGESTEARICAGIVRPDGEFGIVRAQGARDAMRRAVDDLLLPDECAESAKDLRLRSGDLAVFRQPDDGRCALSRVDSLHGSARLLCGLKLHINREDKAGLMLLPNIGPVKAFAIIESRRKDGVFHSVDDLMRVAGIGEKTAQRLAPWVAF